MSETPNPAGRYPHVLGLVASGLWAIERPVLESICHFVAVRHAGDTLTEQEIQARIGAGPARRDEQRVGATAVIPVHGVITPRADLMTEMSGGTSVDRLRRSFLDAVDDKAVSAIVLDVSSPGGMTDMIPELAADIRAARGSKPIVAVANTKAGSAAYWLASQADEVVVTPSGAVGSIGVFAAHDDLSGAMEKAGIKTTLISAGKHKTDGNPYEPLSDEARAAFQERVDEMHAMFTSDVAQGRRVPVESVRSGFGEGRMLMAAQAVKAGLADRVGTLQSVVAEIEQPRGNATASFALAATNVSGGDDRGAYAFNVPTGTTTSFADQASALHANATDLVERLTSLAEVRDGRLTKAKREPLAACPGALREAADAIDGVLAATDPNKHAAAAMAEFVRFERLRANLTRETH